MIFSFLWRVTKTNIVLVIRRTEPTNLKKYSSHTSTHPYILTRVNQHLFDLKNSPSPILWFFLFQWISSSTSPVPSRVKLFPTIFLSKRIILARSGEAGASPKTRCRTKRNKKWTDAGVSFKHLQEAHYEFLNEL